METFHTHLLKGTLYAAFAKANPGEASRLEAYWAGGPYPAVKTETGLALRDAYSTYVSHHKYQVVLYR